MSSLPTVLLVDDEEHSLASMRMTLEDEFDCLTALDADEATRLMEENFVQVILCDHRMPGTTGIEFLSEVRKKWPETVRIVITGYRETNDMIAAINEAGVYQFLTKPWHPDHLMMVAKNAGQLFQLTREHDRMSLEMRFLARSVESKLETRRKALREGLGFEKVLRAPNSPMNAVIEQARKYASFDVPVMICGESGTGKAEIARAIHYTSLRSDQEFYELNCVGLSDAMLQVKLLGAKRGTLPGVPTNKVGLFQKADRGTLFLNGIETLSDQMQFTLLRAATEGTFEQLGGSETLTTNIRFLTGAPDDLSQRVARGAFNKDLFYALARVELNLPPLRSRIEDIGALGQNLLFELAVQHGKPVNGLSDLAVEFPSNYDWPGNLPEFKNELLRMLIAAQDAVLGPELISRHILQADPSQPPRLDSDEDEVISGEGTLKDRIEVIEMRILRETLTRLKWNKSRAANELGLSRVGLRAKPDRCGIRQPRSTVAEQEED